MLSYLTSEMFENYDKTKRLDKFFEINQTTELNLVIYKEVLITLKNNKIYFIDKFGKGDIFKVFPDDTVTIDIDKIYGFTVSKEDSYLLVLTNDKVIVAFFDIDDSKENKILYYTKIYSDDITLYQFGSTDSFNENIIDDKLLGYEGYDGKWYTSFDNILIDHPIRLHQNCHYSGEKDSYCFYCYNNTSTINVDLKNKTCSLQSYNYGTSNRKKWHQGYNRTNFLESYSTIYNEDKNLDSILNNLTFFSYENKFNLVFNEKPEDSLFTDNNYDSFFNKITNGSILYASNNYGNPKAYIDIKNYYHNSITKIQENSDYLNYLGTINNVFAYKIDSNKVIYGFFSLFDGTFYSFKYNTVTNEFSNIEYKFCVQGNVEKVLCNEHYIIIMHDYNEIVLWNIEKNKKEIIVLEGIPYDIYLESIYLAVNIEKKRIEFYKLENIPHIVINNWYIENYNVDNENNYILNNFVTLKQDYNLYDKNNYEVTLYYRNSQVTKTYPETNQDRNLYMKLDKDNIILEPSFYLYNDKIYYSIKNNTTGYEINNFGTSVNKDDLLPKIFIKDIYNLNNSIYFRLRFLMDDAFVLVIELNGRRIIINNNPKKFYTKTGTDGKKYFLVKTGKDGKQRFLIHKLEDVKDTIEQYEYQRVYDNINDIKDYYEWFQIDDIEKEDNYSFNMTLYYKGKLIDTYSNSYPSRNAYFTDILYKTTDGDIKSIEEKLLMHNVENKERFISEMFEPVFENLITNFNINKSSMINNYVNTEQVLGQIDLSTNYDYEFKEHSLVSNIFVNGKKIFRNYYKQFDDLQGNLYSFLPTRLIKDYMSESDYNNFIKKCENKTDLLNGNCDFPFDKYEILINGTRRKLVESENIIAKYTIDNSQYSVDEETIDYGTDESVLQESGVYLFPIQGTISSSINESQLRVYIKKKSDLYFKRFNPVHYTMKIYKKYNNIKLTIKGANYCQDGTEIFIVTNGVLNGLHFYNGFENSPYDIECIPLVENDEDMNFFIMDINNAEDIEVIINGYTLYPQVDYNIITVPSDDSPKLLLFRKKLPKDCIVEINDLNENVNHIRYFKYPAEGTKNIIALNNDEELFVPNGFSVYVNNLKIKNSDIEVLNTNSIRINNQDEISNIMIKFTYDNHTHLKLIKDKYKYDNIDFNDRYYHSFFKAMPPSNFDKLCGDNSESSLLKLLVYNKLDNPDDYSIFDCNDSNGTGLPMDISIDGKPIDNIYCKEDAVIDCNNLNSLN